MLGLYIVGSRWMKYEDTTLVEQYQEMKPEASQGKHIPVPIYPPQIRYRHVRGWTGASDERRRRLTSWNIAGPQFFSGAGIFHSLYFVNTSPLHHTKFVVFEVAAPYWARASSFTRFLDHTQRPTTVGRAPRNECSAQRRDLYLTTHNTHNREKSMPPVGFEPTISADERP